MTDSAVVLQKLTTLRDHLQRVQRRRPLRNRIAHGYASVDVERLWAELPSGIAALDRYAAAVARFVPSRQA